MVQKPSPRKLRREELLDYLEKNPFTTDEELASNFEVSVQTIRLDRAALGIPELRERINTVAREVYDRTRLISERELIGELIDLELDRMGISVMEVLEDMVLESTHVARGHCLFAQANSLAVAVINAPAVLTGSARVRYKRPVYLHERVVAKAMVKTKRGGTCLVSVHSTVDKELVFKGQFVFSILEKNA
ncbi:MAG: transcription factor FapR [Bacillota bacterium]